jgi:TolB-like protein/Flp pilus assembly protein TadD
LAIGFSIALIVSWFFDITSEGIVRDSELPEAQPVLAAGGRRTDFVIIAMLAAAIILLLVWEPPVSGDDALTVLPFESMTGPDEASFSRGLSIELQSLLAQLRKFKVKNAPVESILTRFPDVSTLAREMGVRWVLKGNVRHAENRVRIAVQLIDADDDESIAWSNVFDRDLSAANLFNIQAEIARSIVSELRRSLDEPEEQRLSAPPTDSMAAYTAYLIGRDRLRDRKIAGLEKAVEQFARAIELDPQFAGAYSGLADACYLFSTYSGGQRRDNCPTSAAEFEQLARKAIELDPESGEAWVSLGSAIKNQADGSLESMPRLREAIAAYQRGLELNPNMSQGYHWLGMALRTIFLYPDPPRGWMEAWQKGVWESVFDKGLEVDPLSIPLHFVKTYYPISARNKEEAIRHAHRIVEIAPDSPRGYERLGEQAWQYQGRIDESIRLESKALEIDSKNPMYCTSIGRAYSALGDSEMALAYFDLAKALVAPENQSGQKSLLVQQAVIKLISGQYDAHNVAELSAQLSEPLNWWSVPFDVYVGLTVGQPEDVLARFEEFTPKCIGAKDIPEDYHACPIELLRVYQERGDDAAVRDLGYAIVDSGKLWSDGVARDNDRLAYAAALATTGRTDEALNVMESLVSSGWRGNWPGFLRFTLCCDVTFDAIRDHERFRAIVAMIEADMAQQLENVRAMQRRGEIPTLEEVQAMIASAEREPGSDGE